jgi:hypothetical protein
MQRDDRTWLSYMAAFAAPLVLLGLAVLRIRRLRR